MTLSLSVCVCFISQRKTDCSLYSLTSGDAAQLFWFQVDLWDACVVVQFVCKRERDSILGEKRGGGLEVC